MSARMFLKQTISRCPVCLQPCPGEVWKSEGTPAQVFLSRQCAAHGEHTARIASDARYYWLAHGQPENACCGGAAGGGSCCSADGSSRGTLGRNAVAPGGGLFEQLSTCLALIEIVQSCNLTCPTCFADAPLGDRAQVQAVPLADLQRRIEGVIARKGGIEILQLSGGEPTLHPDLFTLLEWAQQHPRIDYVLINTNGLRVARDPAFAEQLAVAAQRKGLQLYLQFDGPQREGQQSLRGADLRRVREEALAVCARIGLPVTLAMTVTPENLPFVWESVRFGLDRRIVHGITFQPLFQSGRFPATEGGVAQRLNAADLLTALMDQSGGLLRPRDVTPLPCGDPNCAIIGYLIRRPEGFQSIGDFVDFSRLQGFLHDKINYDLADLARCGCEVEPLGALLKQLEVGPEDAFRIMIKPFMDAWTWDQDRIDRCCTHVIRPDGKLDSFCRYYAGFPAARAST